jgi:Asp-tRNA(Asn)/Glu-tRNA(Gln) amidotransferase A subunit family amidase
METSANGLPIGMQLQANHFDEAKLLNIAYHLVGA